MEKESVCVCVFVRVCFKCVRQCGLSSRTCWVVLVPPGSVCCWPTEATSAGLDSPCGVRSIEAWWLASSRTKGAKGERPHSMGLYPMVVCVCVGACERGPYPSGHGEQSRALSNHSLLSKAGQEGKGIVWDCAHNKSAFKVRVKGIFSNDAMWCRLIKNVWFITASSLMSYPWLCIYNRICTEVAVQFNEAVYSDSDLFFILSELRNTIKADVNVDFQEHLVKWALKIFSGDLMFN